MLGVVLAAGDATRMPNKLLLAAPDHSAIIVDSIEYCLRNCYYVDVIIKEGETALEHYLLACYPSFSRLRIRRQNTATGVVDAISLASSNTDLLVAFGDCYGYRSLPLPGRNQATCMTGAYEGLDGWKNGTWATRYMERQVSFSGSFTIDLWQPRSKSLMHEFEAHGISPLICNGVQDCGTPEGYLKVWQE
jgi:hypothetical protein